MENPESGKSGSRLVGDGGHISISILRPPVFLAASFFRPPLVFLAASFSYVEFEDDDEEDDEEPSRTNFEPVAFLIWSFNFIVFYFFYLKKDLNADGGSEEILELYNLY